MASDEWRGPELGPPPPWFFVSVASKGLSLAVSLLSATLTRRSISVAVEGLRDEEIGT